MRKLGIYILLFLAPLVASEATAGQLDIDVMSFNISLLPRVYVLKSSQ